MTETPRVKLRNGRYGCPHHNGTITEIQEGRQIYTFEDGVLDPGGADFHISKVELGWYFSCSDCGWSRWYRPSDHQQVAVKAITDQVRDRRRD